MAMAYEGVTLDNGLVVKNGEIQNKPQFDTEAMQQKIQALQVPQEWTIAKRKAREAAMMKKR
mgnify:CR=1 FL=1|jgi:hypothetical protein